MYYLVLSYSFLLHFDHSLLLLKDFSTKNLILTQGYVFIDFRGKGREVEKKCKRERERERERKRERDTDVREKWIGHLGMCPDQGLNTQHLVYRTTLQPNVPGQGLKFI